MRTIVVDCEHSYGIMRPWDKGFYLSCVGMYDNRGWSKTWWFDHESTELDKPNFRVNWEEIQDELDKADLIGAHNLKHDASILTTLGGITIKPHKLHCTQLTEFILSGQNRERSYSLDAVAEGYGLELKDEAVRSYWDRGIDTYMVPSHILGPYCEKDCKITLRVLERQIELLEPLGVKKITQLDNEFTYMCMEIENNGFALNIERAKEIRAEYGKRVDDADAEVHAIIGDDRVNLSSSAQMKLIMYTKGKVKVKIKYDKWVTKEYKTYPNQTSYYQKKNHIEEITVNGFGFKNVNKGSVDKDTIKSLAARTKIQKKVKGIIQQRNKDWQVCKTLLSKKGDKGLVTKISGDGRVHPSINQTIARTGRLTSSDPNSQNLPRDGTSPIKECIVPSLDGLLQWDLSQIEWRGAAFLSQDITAIDEIMRGVDAHGDNCVQLMCLPLSKKNRTDAKIFLFRMIYGGVAYGFYMDTTMPDFSLDRWQKIFEDFYVKYYGLKQWHFELIRHVTIEGTYRLPTGRWFQYHKVIYKKGTYSFNERQIKNYPVQGLAGDILKLAAVVIMRGIRKMELKSKVILTVHDSIVFDYLNEELDRLIELCEKVGSTLPDYIKSYFGFEWNVPLAGDIEIGYNYGELYKLDKLESLCPIIPKEIKED